METRTFPKGEEKISMLGFGLMRLPVQDGDSACIDEEKATAMVEAALAGGINYFDTAYLYHEGKSEPFAKKALQGVNRQRYFLASKFPTFMTEEKEQIPSFFEEQLANCGVEYFDFYLMHTLDRNLFQKMESLGLYEYLAQQKKAGRIRRLGFSFHDTPEVLEKICAAHEWDFAQIQLNYYDWQVYQSREQYEILRKYGLPCIIMEPLHGGLLADLGEGANAILEKAAPGKSVASWALRYAASLPGVLCVLSGMSTMRQMQDNLATFSPLIPLQNEEKAVLEKALKEYKKRFQIPCSACRYCMPCPFGVDIPDNFSQYNTKAKNGDMQPYISQYEMMGAAAAKNCTGCGACLSKCPQGLDIPHLMAQFEAKTQPDKLTGVLHKR